ncbi:MAG: tRNA (adenosine(37)-N6)-threonylcarbamoyltransferase complex transferase subunit TsaD [Bacteroidales bacterium]|nr:tRNA (adenosine(37)-N6)-threonylcarbamoyltransferase complex transferase subunit TsaD [Bacteroidales bacterium]
MMKERTEDIYILGIESSCDDTSAAVLQGTTMLSNVIAGQKVHEAYGGVVPELASRAHQQNIVPVIDKALKDANVVKENLSAIAFTRGPGLLGSLLVGVSFAKTFSLGLDIPLIEIDHLQAHVLAHFIQDEQWRHDPPKFPFLCLTVSGGHTQIVLVKDYFDQQIVGKTIDDAAGEAFDKTAKILGLPYPGGPVIDKLAQQGNPNAFSFPKPNISDFDYSFSGLKTSILYFLRDRLKENPNFIEQNREDLCASIQKTIVDILLKKFEKAILQYDVRDIALAGGVSANGALRTAFSELGEKRALNAHLLPFKYTTDNATMIAVSGFFKYQKGDLSEQSAKPYSRSSER